MNCSYSSPPTTYSPPWGPANFSDFPPPPTYSPVWSPTSFPPSPPSFPSYLLASSPPPPSPSTSSPLRVRTTINLFSEFQNQQHEDVVDLTVVDMTLFVDYEIEDRGGEFNVINGLEGSALNTSGMEAVFEELPFEVNELEQQHEDIIDQLVIEYAGVDHYVIGYRDGELHTISGGGVFTMNGVEYRQGQALSTTPEPSVVIIEVKLSLRVCRNN